MTMLLLQTLMLMVPAFFIGAALACGLRKLMAPERKVAGVVNAAGASPVVASPEYARRAQLGATGGAVAAAPAPAKVETPAPVAVPAAAPAAAAAAASPNRFDETLKARPTEPPRPAPAAVAPVPAAPPPAAPPKVEQTTRVETTAAAPTPVQRVEDVVKPVVEQIARPAPASAKAPIVAPPPPAAATVRPGLVAEPVRVPAATTPAAPPTTTDKGSLATAAAAAAAAVLAAQASRAASAAPAPAPAPPVAAPATTKAADAAASVTEAVRKLDAPAVEAAAAGATSVVEPLARDTVVPTPAFGAGADDLTRIGMIDAALSSQLQTLGIGRFNQIASWTKADVERVSKALGFQGRIEQENWIEQAQILTTGSETYYSSHRAKIAAAMADAPDVRAQQDAAREPAAPPKVQAAAPAEATPVRPAAPVVPAATASLATPPLVEQRAAFATPKAGTSATAEVANAGVTAPPPDATRIAASPAPTTSGATAIAAAAAAAANAAAKLVRPTGDVVASAAPAAPPAASPPVTPAATAIRPTMAPTRDVLQRIGSISPEIERQLALQGITRYSQVASWGAAEIAKIDQMLGSQGRVARENWVEQAQILAKGGATTASREYDRRASGATAPAAPAAPTSTPTAMAASTVAAAPSAAAPMAEASTTARPVNIADAIRAKASQASGADGDAGTVRSGVSGLRSVRSEAYRTPPETGAVDAPAGGSAPSSSGPRLVRSAEADDLKRIRGVGVLIEKRLNQLGIVSYGQIAEWTPEDIDRVSATLDFKGRIEREHWVEQARILAAGGQTEFSRRVDRGEVETPKPR